MRLTNTLELKSGVNKISLLHGDFAVGNSKTPIAILPAGTQLIEASIEVKTPFKSGNFQGQTSMNAAIRPLLLLGDNSDNSKYLPYQHVDVSGIADEINSGSYFDSPTQYDTDADVILEIWGIQNVWTMSGDLSTARYGLEAAGTQTAGLSFGGYQLGGTGAVTTTEEYNGSSWSSGGAVTTAFYFGGGCGTQTAALKNGGANSSTCEEYNGTSWSAGGASSITFREHGAFGLQTAGINCGGNASTNTNKTESYNGSAWTTENDLNVGREWCWGAGRQSDGFTGNGRQYDDTTNNHITTEMYNGSVWQLSANTIITSSRGRCCGSTSAVIRSHSWNGHEEFDGINWRLSNESNRDQNYHCSKGTQSCGFSAGGYIDNYQTYYTENYDPANMSESSMDGHLILNLTVI